MNNKEKIKIRNNRFNNQIINLINKNKINCIEKKILFINIMNYNIKINNQNYKSIYFNKIIKNNNRFTKIIKII